MTDRITGSVDNGERVTVSFPFYQGQAGTRSLRDGIEVAFLGKLAPNSVGATGFVDGATVTVVTADKLGSGMVRLFVVRP